MILKRNNISLRNEKANKRKEFGHWKCDLIIGAKGMSKSIFYNESRIKIYYANPHHSDSSRNHLNNSSSAELLKNLNESYFRVIEMLGLKNPYRKYLI